MSTVSVSQPAPPPKEDIEVGSFFLETLTTGMYEDPFHCIREYVQNGFDAIQDAIRYNILKSDDSRIVISIGGTSRTPSLTIRDNGSGIPAARAYSTLVSLGASRKTPAHHAGFRGIGRLAGIAYCTTLRFTTKARGESVSTVVEFDCGLVRSYFAPGAEPVDVREVVRSSVKTYQQAEKDPSDHFTEVEMAQLVNLGVEFVEPSKLLPYLQQVCPVEYPDSFTYGERVRNLALGFGDALRVVRVEFRQKRAPVTILKPYKNSYPTGKKNKFSSLHDIQVFTSKENGWFGWIGVSNFPGEIVDETAAGVRFRAKNIQIDGSEIIESLAEELTPAGTERRLQRWAVGEIFITNTQVVPNARRDGFEDNEPWRAIRRDVKDRVVKRVVKLVRSASTTRSAIKAISDALRSLTIALAVPSIAAETKAKSELEIKKHLQTLRSNEKLLGADPKQVSALASKFKELQETLAGLRVEDPKPSDPEPVKTDRAETPEDPKDEPSHDDEDTNVGESRSVLDVVYEVLLKELGETQALKLTNLIAAQLEDEDLI